MASYTGVEVSRHKTLTAATADTVTFTSSPSFVEVKNRGSGTIYFTTDGTAATVEGDDTFVVKGGEALTVPGGSEVEVSLISSTADDYSVTGFDR